MAAHVGKFGLLITAAGGVVLWKVLTLLFFYQQVAYSEGALVIKTLLAVVGVTFVASGLLVFRKVPGRAGEIFALFCICAGLHWGGPIEMSDAQMRTGLIFFYLLVSSILSETLFLQLALIFPTESRLAKIAFVVRIMYLPVIVALLLAIAHVYSRPGTDLHATTGDLFLFMHMLISNLFPILALVLYVSRIVGTEITRTEKNYLGLMIGGMLTAWLPYLFASAVGADTDLWNLTVVVLPLSFAIAFFGIEKSRMRR